MRFSQYHKTESNNLYRKVCPNKRTPLPIPSEKIKLVGRVRRARQYDKQP